MIARVANAAISFMLLTPPPTPAGAALAIIELRAPDHAAMDAALERLGLGEVPLGRTALRDLLSVDRGVVARRSPCSAWIMPHGGALIVSKIGAALERAGVNHLPAEGGAMGPDEDRVEACMLDVLWRATSPLAVDVLMMQRALWQAAAENRPSAAVAEFSADDERRLARLLSPPLVALVGPPNVGKSTLTNAMARREVSIVADEPGTTRDHVGVGLVLDGLAVRWIDAPGVRESAADPIERDALELALRTVASADLVLICGDAGSPPPSQLEGLVSPRAERLRVGLRDDLAGTRAAGFDLVTSSATGLGLDELAREIRRKLLPDALIESPALWRFHRDLPGR